MDFDDPSRIHAAEVIVWLPLGHAPRAGTGMATKARWLTQPGAAPWARSARDPPNSAARPKSTSPLLKNMPDAHICLDLIYPLPFSERVAVENATTVNS